MTPPNTLILRSTLRKKLIKISRASNFAVPPPSVHECDFFSVGPLCPSSRVSSCYFGLAYLACLSQRDSSANDNLHAAALLSNWIIQDNCLQLQRTLSNCHPMKYNHSLFAIVKSRHDNGGWKKKRINSEFTAAAATKSWCCCIQLSSKHCCCDSGSAAHCMWFLDDPRNQIYLSDILITDGAAMIEPTFRKTENVGMS